MRLCSWRFIVACLLVLLLPLQGVAAAALNCHAGPVPTALPAARQVQDHSLHHAQHPHHAQAQHQASSDADPAEAHTHAAHADGKPAKCNSCSPCCAGVLVGQVRTPAFAAARNSANFPEPVAQVPSPTLAGLDRPPRHYLL
nr:hypothetical protein [Rhodoferax sp.]